MVHHQAQERGRRCQTGKTLSKLIKEKWGGWDNVDMVVLLQIARRRDVTMLRSEGFAAALVEQFGPDAEKKIAGYFGTEESLYFVSGYLSSLFMAQGVADQFDVAFVDETGHFSVKDGIYTTRKPVVFLQAPGSLGPEAKLKSELKVFEQVDPTEEMLRDFYSTVWRHVDKFRNGLLDLLMEALPSDDSFASWGQGFIPVMHGPEVGQLVKGLEDGMECQTLLGVTGSGKTFTIANVIEKFRNPRSSSPTTAYFSTKINLLTSSRSCAMVRPRVLGCEGFFRAPSAEARAES
jgi:hypothetical protein